MVAGNVSDESSDLSNQLPRPGPEHCSIWFLNRLHHLIANVAGGHEHYRLKNAFHLYEHELCVRHHHMCVPNSCVHNALADTSAGFFYPETTGRSLEDMECLFNKDFQPRASLEGPDHYRDEEEDVDATLSGAQPKATQT